MSGKFRDKETGVEGYLRANREIEYQIEDEDGFPINGSFKTLAELLDKWEEIDEEPKEYWFINGIGKVEKAPSDWLCNERDYRQAIGNYFETKEEAEKAVEKLKGWKRLKDKNIFIYLDHFDYRSQEGSFNVEFGDNLSSDELNQVNDDLDLLFGGEE